jgi:hypothetical protein
LGRKKSTGVERRTQHAQEMQYVSQKVREGIDVRVGYLVLNGKVFVTMTSLCAAHYKYDLRFEDDDSKFAQIKSI